MARSDGFPLDDAVNIKSVVNEAYSNVLVYRRSGPRHTYVQQASFTFALRIGRLTQTDVLTRPGPEERENGHYWPSSYPAPSSRYTQPSRVGLLNASGLRSPQRLWPYCDSIYLQKRIASVAHTPRYCWIAKSYTQRKGVLLYGLCLLSPCVNAKPTPAS